MKNIAFGCVIVLITAQIGIAEDTQIYDIGLISIGMTIDSRANLPNCFINDNNLVTGSTRIGVGTSYAFVWENGSKVTFSGFMSGYSYGCGINNSDQFVCTENGSPVLWQKEDIPRFGPSWDKVNLQTLPATAIAHPLGISDSGRIVGFHYYNFPMLLKHTALMWKDDQVVDLGTMHDDDNFSAAYSINNSDQVVGYSGDNAFLWQNNQWKDLGKIGNDVSAIALSINNNGQVVGYSSDSDDNRHAFLWQEDKINSLNGPDSTESWAYGINEAGKVVGAFQTDDGPRACLWDNGELIDLNLFVEDTGWVLQEAFDINNSDMVVGYGINPNNQSYCGFIIEVPEPGSIMFMLTGLLWLTKQRKRNRACSFSCVNDLH